MEKMTNNREWVTTIRSHVTTEGLRCLCNWLENEQRPYDMTVSRLAAHECIGSYTYLITLSVNDPEYFIKLIKNANETKA